MAKRKYTLKRRARRQEETRKRIVKAAMALHEELGPRETTISAIAARAGVQRLTVYRHFPDGERLFAACTGSWLALNPPPDPQDWEGVEDPAARTRVALGSLYRYYRETAGMWSSAFRDREVVPAMEKPMEAFDAYLDGLRSGLLEAWEARHGPAGSARGKILGHALRFSTWQSLDAEGMEDPEMADLMARWLEAVGSR